MLTILEMGDHFTLNYNVKVNPLYRMQYNWFLFSLKKYKIVVILKL